MSLKTNFRRIDRLQFAKDIVIDKYSSDLGDRMTKIRGKVGRVTPDEMSISPRVWAKMPRVAKEREETHFWASLRIKAQTEQEFQADLAVAKECFGL